MMSEWAIKEMDHIIKSNVRNQITWQHLNQTHRITSEKQRINLGLLLSRWSVQQNSSNVLPYS